MYGPKVSLKHDNNQFISYTLFINGKRAYRGSQFTYTSPAYVHYLPIFMHRTKFSMGMSNFKVFLTLCFPKTVFAVRKTKNFDAPRRILEVHPEASSFLMLTDCPPSSGVDRQKPNRQFAGLTGSVFAFGEPFGFCFW